jgi:hypothetical protein
MTEAILLNFKYRVNLFVLDREAADAHSPTLASYAAFREGVTVAEESWTKYRR